MFLFLWCIISHVEIFEANVIPSKSKLTTKWLTTETNILDNIFKCYVFLSLIFLCENFTHYFTFLRDAVAALNETLVDTVISFDKQIL